MGGDVELSQLVAVEREREEGGDHLGTNHCVGEAWKGEEIDEKDGWEQFYSRWDLLPQLSHMLVGNIVGQPPTSHPHCKFNIFPPTIQKIFSDSFNKILRNCPTSIFYAICRITIVSRIVMWTASTGVHPHSSENWIVLEGKDLWSRFGHSIITH